MNRADGASQQRVLFLQCPALQPQGVRQLSRTLEHYPDLLQRDPEKLERDDLLERLQIALAIDAVPGLRPPRLQKSQAIVVMQRLDGDPRQLGELMNFVVLAQIQPSNRHAKV